MIHIKHLDKDYHKNTPNEVQLFDDFSLSIDAGEFVSIIGSNGSGKTSLLNIICGAASVDAGEIYIGDREVSSLKEYERYAMIGRVFQDPGMGTAPSMTILENLAMADNKNKSWNLTRAVDRHQTHHYRDLLAEIGLGLEDKLDTPVGMLSGGQRQALALVMVSLSPVKILLLDEHTAALDPKTADTIMAYTDRLVQTHGLTALMVTHNLNYSLAYGSRLLMMHKGQTLIDKWGAEKDSLALEDILDRFNQISIESGNSI